MKRNQAKTTTVSLALSAVLLIGGCKSNNQQQAPNNNPAQYPQQQGQPNQVPNQSGQQAMNPEGAPQPESERGRERRDRGAYAAGRQDYNQAQQPGYNQSTQQGYNQSPPPPPQRVTVIPAGTHIVVTLGQTISTKTSQTGDSFSATVAEPVVVRGQTLVRAGAPASGTVVDSKSAGHFKGQGTLAIRLDSVRAEGHSYEVATSTVDRVEKGKGKRTAVMTGGGGGLGAIIGGIAGGGKGALIGGLAGAGAGGVGSAFTGNHELEIPAETQLTFRLERDVPLR